MAEEKGYNGWTNYETWCAALWGGNDSSTYDYLRELAKEAREYCENEPVNPVYQNPLDIRVKSRLSHALKEYMEENNPLGDGASVYTDLLQSAIDSIDYYEWAENLLED